MLHRHYMWHIFFLSFLLFFFSLSLKFFLSLKRFIPQPPQVKCELAKMRIVPKNDISQALKFNACYLLGFYAFITYTWVSKGNSSSSRFSRKQPRIRRFSCAMAWPALLKATVCQTVSFGSPSEFSTYNLGFQYRSHSMSSGYWRNDRTGRVQFWNRLRDSPGYIRTLWEGGYVCVRLKVGGWGGGGGSGLKSAFNPSTSYHRL